MLGTLITVLKALMVLMPLASVIRLIATRTTKISAWLISAALAAVGSYMLLIASVQLTEVHLDRILAGYDLNGDDSFSGVEITPEMELAMENVTHDTGRTFAPFTGLVICPIYSGFWHSIIGIPFLLLSNHHQKKKENKAEMATPRKPSD